MPSLSLRSKIFLGFGLLVAGLIGLAAMSAGDLRHAGANFDTYRDAALKNARLTEAEVDFLQAIGAFERFRIYRNESYAELVEGEIAQLESRRAALAERFAGDALAARVSEISTVIDGFRATFESYRGLATEAHEVELRVQEVGQSVRRALGEIMDSAHADMDGEAAYRAADVQEELMLTRLYAQRALDALNPDYAARAAETLARARELVAPLERSIENSRRLALLPQVRDGLAALDGDVARVVTLVPELESTAGRLGEAAHAGLTVFDEATRTTQARQDEIGPRADAEIEAALRRGVTVGVIAAALGAALALALGLTVSRALTRFAGSLRALAAGESNVTVFGRGRRDEIGVLAEAVGLIEANAAAKADADRAREEAMKAQAERDRQEGMTRLADDFQAAVGGIVARVAASAREMQAAAQMLTSASEQTSGQASAVAAASEEAAANVDAVAAAAEELAASVAEIGRQVSDSTRLAGSASREANGAVTRVRAMADAADTIGAIVALIQDIAEQTNLLALNATIEAARAGEAGRGFAVVAAEVKSLADQTARATIEIREQIQGIQGSTSASARAISDVADIIGRLDATAAAIAAAVEEQGASTREIARNVQEASAGTGEVSNAITGVTQAAHASSAAASQVLASASGLSEQTDALTRAVEGFVRAVLSGPLDRRRGDDPNYAGPEGREDPRGARRAA